MAGSLDRFLGSPVPYVASLTARELGSPRAPELRSALAADPGVGALVDELGDWPGPSIASHKSSRQFFHKLAFLAEIGLDLSHPGLAAVAEKVLARVDAQGIPTAPVQIGPAYGGTGGPVEGWALCDAPVTLAALVRLGAPRDRLGPAVAHLASLGGENGYGCRVSGTLGTWRGPGKASDPCPYATLVMLRLLTAWGQGFQDRIDACAATLLDLWENSRTRHPYIFWMGNDFRKLKLPFVWYDILHVAEVLSLVPGVRTDPRFLDMVTVIRAQGTPEGYTPASVYQPWKDWDFGQKKVPSEGLAFFVARLETRLAQG